MSRSPPPSPERSRLSLDVGGARFDCSPAAYRVGVSVRSRSSHERSSTCRTARRLFRFSDDARVGSSPRPPMLDRSWASRSRRSRSRLFSAVRERKEAAARAVHTLPAVPRPVRFGTSVHSRGALEASSWARAGAFTAPADRAGARGGFRRPVFFDDIGTVPPAPVELLAPPGAGSGLSSRTASDVDARSVGQSRVSPRGRRAVPQDCNYRLHVATISCPREARPRRRASARHS